MNEQDEVTTLKWLYSAETKLREIQRIVDDPGLWSAYSVRREELRFVLEQK